MNDQLEVMFSIRMLYVVEFLVMWEERVLIGPFVELEMFFAPEIKKMFEFMEFLVLMLF